MAPPRSSRGGLSRKRHPGRSLQLLRTPLPGTISPFVVLRLLLLLFPTPTAHSVGNVVGSSPLRFRGGGVLLEGAARETPFSLGGMRDEGALLPDGYLPRRIYEGRLGSVVAIDIRGPPRPRAPWMQETAQLSNSG